MRYITADTIYTMSSEPLKNAAVAINNDGSIDDVLQDISVLDPIKIERFEGILSPGFVNTHCHLELSHLKNKITERTGIVGFATELMQKRFFVQSDEIQQAMLDADEEMYKNGIVAVGDISNDGSSFNTKAKSKIYYHTFIELLALNPERAELVFEAGKILLNQLQELKLSGSLAPHAPYSVSAKLIELISHHENKPTSIHNQESVAEDDFIRNKTGDFLKLYQLLNIPLDYYSPPGTSSLRAVLNHFSKQKNTLLVHNTFTPESDVEWGLAQQLNVSWCFCPNANLYIENKLPNVNDFIKHNCHITLGTDSLASNHGLNIMEEIKTLSTHFPNLSLQTMLEWATINGARFLGIDKTFGSIEKGKKPGLVLISEKNQITRLL